MSVKLDKNHYDLININQCTTNGWVKADYPKIDDYFAALATGKEKLPRGREYYLHFEPTLGSVRIFQPKTGLDATLVQATANTYGERIMTFNVKYWLMIHAEFLRHRTLSRGVKSNRAIPTKKIRQEVLDTPYVPVFFGRNQSGMVADQEVDQRIARMAWKAARYPAVFAHWFCDKIIGGHKEWVNRILAPWQYVRETITATEFDNLWSLRLHKDAQRDIKEIVKLMHLLSTLYGVRAGEMYCPVITEGSHVPYVTRSVSADGTVTYFSDKQRTEVISEDVALMCSAARCARSSYDNHDKSAVSVQKDLALYNVLIESKPAHASPVEHQAKAIKPELEGKVRSLDIDGITHLDSNGRLWSGNFKGFKQFRQTIKDHVCNSFKL